MSEGDLYRAWGRAMRLRESELGTLLLCESCPAAVYIDELDECGLSGQPLYDQSELQPGKCQGAGRKNHEGMVRMKDGRHLCMDCYCRETEPPFWNLTIEPRAVTLWHRLAAPDDPAKPLRQVVRVASDDPRLRFWPDHWIVNREPVYEKSLNG